MVQLTRLQKVLIYTLIFWTCYLLYSFFIKNQPSTTTTTTSSQQTQQEEPEYIPLSQPKINLTSLKNKLKYKISGGSTPNDFFKFTKNDLQHYNGKFDKNLPILLSIKGRIYDVTKGKSHYGPGGSYHFFVGRDGTRSFVTGCFDEKNVECTERSSSLEGFDKDQMKTVDGWVKFYDEKYDFIGYLVE
ncbi:hypothetical protein ABK040_016661 [Willaertia magna]